jgi:hypothetical protein
MYENRKMSFVETALRKVKRIREKNGESESN